MNIFSKPSAQHARRIGCVTKPRLTCSITSNASTMLNVDTRQSATEAPWSSRCRRGYVRGGSTKPGGGPTDMPNLEDEDPESLYEKYLYDYLPSNFPNEFEQLCLFSPLKGNERLIRAVKFNV